MSSQEQHFKIKDIAKLWNYSLEKTRQLFVNRTDIIRSKPARMEGKRPYHNIRVPKSVMDRVYNEQLAKGKVK